jgi:seryl-tRNA(Sec) selenium transferase
MLYAFSTHERDAIEVPLKECAMLGNAMLTIVASTNATAAPNEAIASTRRGVGAPRLTTLVATAGSTPAALDTGNA